MNIRQWVDEIRAGRVLSAKNESALRAAVEALQAVLDQLGIEEDDARGILSGTEKRVPPICTGIEVRAESDKPPTLLGHAALFNTKSVYLYGFREIIEPGAFSESIANSDIRALYQHNSERILGRTKSGTLRLWEDDQGLAFELVPPNNSDGNGALESISRGDVDQMSFGFNVPPGGDSWGEDDDGIPLRRLRTVSLMEISPVTWAAYPQTGVGVMRSAPDWVQRALNPGVDDSSKAAGKARARRTQMLREIELLSLRRVLS